MAFKTGVTTCAVIYGSKVRQDYRQVYCLPPPAHSTVMPQGVETNSISVDTPAKTLKKYFFPRGFAFALKKDKNYSGKRTFSW